MYVKFFKRFFDIVLSFCALVVLSPLLLVLTVVGTFAMRGNPFFVQERPGKDEKIFKLIKFRTMSNLKDENGELLPDEQRLNKYGIWLRKTSCDELLEIINILKGDMSVVGPRPLVPQYIPYYTETEHHRHDVRPGLTGLAQVNGRNSINWEEKFDYDIKYVNSITFLNDIRIILLSVKTVITKEDIGTRGIDAPIDFDIYRKQQAKEKGVENEYSRR
ncbi:MAG: sugar transferase [Eubacterium sp.]|nr:sugar transferase [Eubacterium sp.]